MTQADLSMVLRPKPRSQLSQKLFTSVIVVGLLGVVAYPILTESLNAGALANMLGFVVIVGIVASWILADDKRARSIEVSREGVNGLIWKKISGIVPYGLSAATIRWSNVVRIGRSGLVVYVEDKEYQIAINTYLFDDPESVIAFINERTSRPGLSL